MARSICFCALVGLAAGAFSPMSGETILILRRTGPPPTIDGLIHADEWAPAFGYDISDTAGRGGVRRPPGSNLMYHLYDDSFAYFASDCPFYHERQDGDQLGLYVDENNDGLWAEDSSEGAHFAMVVPGGDRVDYYALAAGFPVWPCTGAVAVSSLLSGHLQFEVKIPIGPRKSDYTIGPGDTVRAFLFTAVRGGSFFGWWPQTLLEHQWFDPQFYGPMVFDTSFVGLTAGKDLTLPAISVFPNPARAGHTLVRISFSPSRAAAGSLDRFCVSIIDAAGRIAQSEVGNVELGTTLDLRTLSAGVYLVRLTSGSLVRTGRLTIHR